MQVFLVKQKLKFSIFKYLFKAIEIKDDRIILNCNLEKINQKKKIKIVNKISKILKKNSSDTVIVCKKLKKDKDFFNLLYSKQISVLTGKILFKELIKNILEDLESEIKREDTEIAIATNYKDKWVSNLIINLSKQFKSLKVVSNNLNYFRPLQENLLEKDGIILTISNNKRKSFIKSNIIINIDFPENLLNKYSIYEKSIIINLEEKIKIHKKRFSGKIIDDYEVCLREESQIAKDLKTDKYKEFDLKDLTECYVLNKPEELKNVTIREIK